MCCVHSENSCYCRAASRSAMASIVVVCEWHCTLWTNVKETFTLPDNPLKAINLSALFLTVRLSLLDSSLYSSPMVLHGVSVM